MITANDVLARIDERIEAVGLPSRRAASLAAGMGTDGLRNIVRGRSAMMGVQKIYRLARVLDCSPDYLLHLTDNPNGIASADTPGAASAFVADEIPGYESQDRPDQALIAALWYLTEGRRAEAAKAASHFLALVSPEKPEGIGAEDKVHPIQRPE